MRGKLLAAGLCLLPLVGCVSLHDLGNTTPVYSGEMKGNYYDIAECAKARQSKLVPGVRIELLHDKPAHEATVTWNHEFGALNAFVFKQTGPGQTEFKLYSAAGRSQSWIDLTRTCEQS